MKLDFSFKDRYNIEDLLHIVHILRDPEIGCPWDKEQNHESIKQDFVEETYEVLDAIDRKSLPLLQEELGDVLMQVVFHADIEQDADHFNFDDVCDGICKKLIYRHPHVFSDTVADTTDEVLKNWDKLKKTEKQIRCVSDSIDALPLSLPALIRAAKVQSKAAKVGFDWTDIEDVYAKLQEEIGEVRQASDSGIAEDVEDELGDVLFSVVNLSRFLKVKPEEALNRATAKFAHRFRIVEELAQERHIDMSESTIEELDKLWDEAKTL